MIKIDLEMNIESQSYNRQEIRELIITDDSLQSKSKMTTTYAKVQIFAILNLLDIVEFEFVVVDLVDVLNLIVHLFDLLKVLIDADFHVQ